MADLATGQISTVSVGQNPYGVAISPDGRTTYVSNQGASTVSKLDISGAVPHVTGTITVGIHPNRMVMDPRTGTLYVDNSESDSVSAVPAGAGSPSRTIWRTMISRRSSSSGSATTTPREPRPATRP